MKTKTRLFKNIYYVEDAAGMADSDFDNLVMVSTKNWNHYFSRIDNVNGLDITKMKNVKYIEFSTQDEMFTYWTKALKKRPINLVDYSVECGVPCILESVG